MSDRTVKKIDIELDLNISGSKAQKQVEAIAKHIQSKITNLGKGVDLTVFKDLVNYLSAVETKMLELQSHDATSFDKLFGVNGANITGAMQKELSGLSDPAMKVVDLLKQVDTEFMRFNKADSDIKIKDLQNVANSLRTIYTLLGQPVPSLLDSIKGKGHIQDKIEDLQEVRYALEDVRIDWEELNKVTSEPTKVNNGKTQADNIVRDYTGAYNKIKDILTKIRALSQTEGFADTKEYKVLKDEMTGIVNGLPKNLQTIIGTLTKKAVLTPDKVSEESFNKNLHLIEVTLQKVSAAAQKAKQDVENVINASKDVSSPSDSTSDSAVVKKNKATNDSISTQIQLYEQLKNIIIETSNARRGLDKDEASAILSKQSAKFNSVLRQVPKDSPLYKLMDSNEMYKITDRVFDADSKNFSEKNLTTKLNGFGDELKSALQVDNALIDQAGAKLDDLGTKADNATKKVKKTKDAAKESSGEVKGVGDNNKTTPQPETKTSPAPQPTSGNENKTSKVNVGDANPDIKSFSELEVVLQRIIDLIAKKNELLAAEGGLVSSELQSFTQLATQVEAVKTNLSMLKEAKKEQATTDEVKQTPNAIVKTEQPSAGYALETTLNATNGILNQILSTLNSGASSKEIATALSSLSTKLEAISGVWKNVGQERRTIADESVAANRIEKYNDTLAAQAANQMQSKALPGTTPIVTGMKSLKDGVVEVNGVLQTGEEAWSRYTIKLSESGRVVGAVVQADEKLTASKLKEIELEKQLADAKRVANESVARFMSDNGFAKSNEAVLELQSRLRTISSGDELASWRSEWNKTTVEILKTADAERRVAEKDAAKQKLLDAGATALNVSDTSQYINSLKKKIKYNPTAGDEKLISGQDFTANSINQTYERLAQSIQNVREQQGLATQEQINDIRTNIQYLEQYIAEQNKAAEAAKRTAKSMSAGDEKKFSKEQLAYNTLTTRVAQDYSGSTVVGSAVESYTAELEKFTTLYGQMKAAGGNVTAEMQAEFDAQAQSTAKARKELEQLITSSDKLAASGRAMFNNFDSSKMDDIAQRTAALRAAFEQVRGRGKTFEGMSDDASKLFYTINAGNGTVQHMALEFNAARTAIVQTSGEVTKTTSVFTQFFDALKTRARFFVSGMGLRYAWNELKQGIGYVKELDAAMTELRKVSEGTEAQYAKLLSNLQTASPQVARTPTELVNSAADWARIGMSLEDSELMAKNTAILMNVSEFTDINDATNSMISAMKAYRYEAGDTMQIIDQFNNVGNNFAISTAEAADSLTRSGAALYAAGNDLSQSLALTAAANTFVQNPESVGNALKTLSMRIRGTKAELEEAGEETDGMATSVSKLRASVAQLTNVRGDGGFDILQDSGAYKSTYDILLGISKVWKDMSDIDQAALLELIAGKRQGSIVAGILESPEILQSAYDTAVDSAGSAMEENEKYLNSVNGKLDVLKATIQTLWTGAINSNTLKFFLDIGNAILSATKNIGGFNVALGALAVILSRKFNFNISEKIFGKMDAEAGKRVGGWVQKYQDYRAAKAGTAPDTSEIAGNKATQQAVTNLQAEWKKNVEAVKYYQTQLSDTSGKTEAEVNAQIAALERLRAEQTELGNAINTLNNKSGTQMLSERVEAINKQNTKFYKNMTTKSGKDIEGVFAGFTNAREQGTEAEWLKNNIDDLTDSQVHYIDSCKQGEVTTQGYAASIKAHNAGLKASSIASKAAAIGMQAFNMAVSFGVGLLMSMAMSAITNLINQQENMAKAAKEASEAYEKANKTYQDNAQTINEVGAEYEKLSKGVDENGNNISLTTEEFEKYHEITSKIADMFPELVTGYDAQGNAILSLADSTDTATEALKKLNDEEKRAAAGELMEKQNDIIQTAKNKITTGQFGSKSEEYEWQRITALANGDRDWSAVNRNEYLAIGKMLQGKGLLSDEQERILASALGGHPSRNFNSMIQEVIRNNKESVITAAQPAAADTKAAIEDLKQLIEAYGAYNEEFMNLSSEQQAFVNKNIKGLSNEQVLALLPSLEDDPNAAANKLYDTYIQLAQDSNFMDAYKEAVNFSSNIKQNTRLDSIVEDTERLKTKLQAIIDANPDIKNEDKSYYESMLDSILSVDSESFKQNIRAINNAISDGEDVGDDIEQLKKRLGKLGWTRKDVEYAGTLDIAGVNGESVFAGMTAEQAHQYVRQQMVLNNVSSYDPAQGYDDLKKSVDNYASALSAVNQITADNTSLTEGQAEALQNVLGDLKSYGDAIDTENGNTVKSVTALKKALAEKRKEKLANIQLSRSQAQLQYGQLTLQLGNSVRGMSSFTDEQWRNIASTIDEMNALEGTITQYQMLESQLLGATDAYAQFQRAKEIDSQMDTAAQVTDMFTALKEGFESGKVGSQTFQAAVKGMVPYEIWGKFENDGQAAIDAIEDYYNNTLGKYVTNGDNGIEITQDNIETFLTDLKGAGVIDGSIYDFKINPEVEGIDDAIKKLDAYGVKLTKTTFFDLMQAFQNYNVDWEDYPLFDLLDKDQSYDSKLYVAQQELADLYKTRANLVESGESTIEIDADISKAENNLNTLNAEVLDAASKKHQIEIDIQNKYSKTGDPDAMKMYAELRRDGASVDEAYKTVTTKFDVQLDKGDFETGYLSVLEDFDELQNYSGVTETSVTMAMTNAQERIKYLQDQIDQGINVKANTDELNDLQSKLTALEDAGYTIPTEFSIEDSMQNIEEALGRAVIALETLAGIKPKDGSVLDVLSNGADIGIGIAQESTGLIPQSQQSTYLNNTNKAEQYENTRRGIYQYNYPKDTTVMARINLDDKDASEKLRLIEGYQINDKDFNVDAETEDADSKVKLIDGSTIDKKSFEIDADGLQALTSIEAINEATVHDKDVFINSDNTEAMDAVSEVNKTQVEDKESKITGDSSSAITTVTHYKNWLSGINLSKQITLNAIAQTTTAFDNLLSWWKNQPSTETKTKKTKYVTETVNKTVGNIGGFIGANSADGNAHALGTAFAGGHWGAPRTEEALVGELGPEMVVTPATGRWRIVGDNGAEFTKIHSGDIIFNHLQTEQLLKNRHINGRGSSFASGTAYAGPRDKKKKITTSSTNKSGSGNSGGNNNGGGKNGNSSTKNAQSATEKLAEQYSKFVDWVAVKLERAADATAKAMDSVEANAGRITKTYKSVGKGKGDYVKRNSKYQYAGPNKGNYDIDLYSKSPSIKSINNALKINEKELKANRAAQIKYKGMLGQVQTDFQKIKDSKGKPILTNDMIRLIQQGAGISLKKGRLGKGDYDSKGNYVGSGKGSYNYMFGNAIVKYGSDRQKAIETYKQWWDTYSNTGKNIKELEKQKKELQEKKFQEIVDYYSRLVDWVQIKLERIAANTEAKVDAIDNYTQRLNNTYTNRGKGKGNYTKTKDGKYKYVGKNKGQYTRNTGVLGAINDAIYATRTERSINQQGYNRYMRQARDVQVSTGLSSKIVKKIQSGAIEITEYDDKTQQKIEEYQKWYDAAQACKKTIKELNDQEKELYARRFDEIEQYYSSRIGFQDSRKGFMESRVAYREAQGYLKSSANTNYLLSLEETQKAEVQKQKNDLLSELNRQVQNGQVVYASKEWYEYKAKIDDCTQALLEHNQAIEDLKNQLGEIRAYNFDHLRSEYSNLGSELSNLYDLVSKKDVWKYVNDKNNGKWTKEGLTAIGMAAQQMELAKREANAYAKEITYLGQKNKQGVRNYIALGYSTIEYKDKVAELTQAQWAQIDAYESAKDKIQSLNSARVQTIKDGIQKEIDAYSELINKQKKSLQEKRETHDYNKKVADQQKSIAKIQSQIDALALDSSQSAAAKRKKLEAELLDEKTNLNEIYYDHDLEMQEEALDKNLEIFQKDKEKIIENLEKSLEDIETITKNSISSVKNNASQVSSELSTLSEQYGLTISTEITQPWEKGASALQSYTNQFKSNTSEWVTALQGVENQWKKNIAAANKYADIDKQNTINNSKQGTPNKNLSYPKLYSKSKKYVTLEYGAFGSGNDVKKGVTDAKGNFINYKVMAINKKNGTVDLVSADGKKKLKGFSVRKLRGYKFGTTNLPNTGFVRIDEDNLEELVLHAGKDGKIQYLTKGSGVVPNDLTKNLMQWGKLDPRQILMANTPTPPSATHFTNNTINLNIGEVVHIDHADRDSIPDITNAVQKQIDQYMKNVNQKLRIKT